MAGLADLSVEEAERLTEEAREGLSPTEIIMAERRAAQKGIARGRELDVSQAARFALERREAEEDVQARRAELARAARMSAQGAAGAARVDPFTAILGRTPSAYQTAAQLSLGPLGTMATSPTTALGLGQAEDYRRAQAELAYGGVESAYQQARGQIQSSMIGGIGSSIGGFIGGLNLGGATPSVSPVSQAPLAQPLFGSQPGGYGANTQLKGFMGQPLLIMAIFQDQPINLETVKGVSPERFVQRAEREQQAVVGNFLRMQQGIQAGIQEFEQKREEKQNMQASLKLLKELGAVEGLSDESVKAGIKNAGGATNFLKTITDMETVAQQSRLREAQIAEMERKPGKIIVRPDGIIEQDGKFMGQMSKQAAERIPTKVLEQRNFQDNYKKARELLSQGKVAEAQDITTSLGMIDKITGYPIPVSELFKDIEPEPTPKPEPTPTPAPGSPLNEEELERLNQLRSKRAGL